MTATVKTQTKPTRTRMPKVEIERVSPGEARLDEALADIRLYVNTSESNAVAMTLYAAATYVCEAFPSFGRMLFVGDGPNCGKTTAMLTTAYLSNCPENTKGTKYALQSLLAEYHNAPERGRPCCYRDEISSVFGASGLNDREPDIANVLREGYMRNATQRWSVNRVSQKYSIYTPFLMTGNGVAVPNDIRSRCIVVKCKRGRPGLALDADDADTRLKATGAALGAEVKRHASEMRGWACENIVDGMVGREHQVWRPLIAVAKFVGGDKWLKMALNAYLDLASKGSGSVPLSANQQTLKDIAEIVTELELSRESFIGGKTLAEYLGMFKRFEGWNQTAIRMEIARAMPVKSVEKMFDGVKAKGYFVGWILDAWEANKPVAPEEVSAYAPVDPFDC